MLVFSVNVWCLTIRSSRCHFTAAIFFGMFVLICGRAVARLNSGVRLGKKQFSLLGWLFTPSESIAMR